MERSEKSKIALAGRMCKFVWDFYNEVDPDEDLPIEDDPEEDAFAEATMDLLCKSEEEKDWFFVGYTFGSLEEYEAFEAFAKRYCEERERIVNLAQAKKA